MNSETMRAMLVTGKPRGGLPFLHTVLLGIVIGLVSVAVSAATSNTLNRTRPSIAVIYSEAELKAEEFQLIVAGIESNPDVIVYRVALDTPQQDVPKRTALLRVADATGAIAVIYPDIGEPYRGVFVKIIEGIEDKAQRRVTSIAVGTDVNVDDVTTELRKQNIKVVIALGRHGLNVASGLHRDIGVIAGGVISVPETESRPVAVLSLAPDPALMFARLKAFMPAARRVFVVYNPQHNAWLVRLAREAAAAHGLELIAHEATDMKSAVLQYKKIFSQVEARRDALWLPQDPTTVEDSTILPLVLQDAWNGTLPVFSSNVAHVRRGVLFALYPNNVELGRNLAGSALNYLSSGDASARKIAPLKDVLVAVNVRTAGHLGIQLSMQQQQRFDLVFPQQ
ncbi:MAG TPA: ABC transporter substrate binding protein [Burkholderiaceae bacterium]|nr:ABC transporter substrate binding protein [Burkholderiaceae bacterium]